MALRKVQIFLLVVSTLHSFISSCPESQRKNRKSRSIIFPGESYETKRQEQEHCVTPLGREGQCIIVTNCQQLWNHRRNYHLLRRLNCGYQGEVPKVCCPVCSTTSTVPMPAAITTSPTIPPYLQQNNRGRRPLVALPLAPPTNQPGRTGQITRMPTGSDPKRTILNPLSNSTSNRRKLNTKTPAAARNYDDILSLLPRECGRNDVPLRRIVGGQESVIGAWPWLGALFLSRKGIRTAECGGALVTAKHVITAAHCTVNGRRGTLLDPSQITVRLGDHDLESDDDGLIPVEAQVQSIIKHENFVLRTFQNDIAILVLTTRVQFHRYVMPICIPYGVFGDDHLAGRNGFVAGWGTTSFDGPASSRLLEVQLRIWENRDCEEVFRKDVPITSVNLCAGDGDKDACRGDSGGPLMLPHSDGRFYMVGIVSFGKKCAEPGIPGVYTRISSFLDWIALNIKSTL